MTAAEKEIDRLHAGWEEAEEKVEELEEEVDQLMDDKARVTEQYNEDECQVCALTRLRAGEPTNASVTTITKFTKASENTACPRHPTLKQWGRICFGKQVYWWWGAHKNKQCRLVVQAHRSKTDGNQPSSSFRRKGTTTQ